MIRFSVAECTCISWSRNSVSGVTGVYYTKVLSRCKRLSKIFGYRFAYKITVFAMVRESRIDLRPEQGTLHKAFPNNVSWKGRVEVQTESQKLTRTSHDIVSWKGSVNLQSELATLHQDTISLKGSAEIRPESTNLLICQDIESWRGRTEPRAELLTFCTGCKDTRRVEVRTEATLHTACKDTVVWKGRAEVRPEGVNLPTACQDTTCAETFADVSTPEVHVLAVDDSVIDRKVIERLLKISSFKVTTVDSAPRALEFLGLHEGRSPSISVNVFGVNLIVTDYCMPGMTGYDLLKRVKAQTSALKDIPVVIMSSENVPSRIERCLAEGAEEFLIKPVKLADMKRLQGLIRPSRSSGSCESSASSSSCPKRKIGSSEGLQVKTSPERRLRLSGVIVA